MIRICEKKKDGFSIVLKSDEWQMAIVTYEDQYDIKNHTKMARHMTTDEAFVLINGEAVLFSENENNSIEKICLEKNKIYCIEKGTWHSLAISHDSVLIATENSNINPEETERKVLL